MKEECMQHFTWLNEKVVAIFFKIVLSNFERPWMEPSTLIP